METVNLNDYVENPDNPQTVSDADFAELVKSLRDTPWTLEAAKISFALDYVSPITGTDFTGKRVVIAGNKRLRGLKKIAAEGGLVLNGVELVSPNGDVPAVWFFDLTPLGSEARRRWLVKSNVQTGDWEAELLMKLYSADELAGLMGPEQLDAVLRQYETAPANAKKDADDVPAAPSAEPDSSPGTVYKLGPHRLMCGNATQFDDVARLVDGEQVKLLLTDPPYNVDHKGSTTKKRERILNDAQQDVDFLRFIVGAFQCADAVMCPGAAFYIWHANLESYNFHGACRVVGWQVREVLQWLKTTFVIGRQDYQWKHEPCLYGWKAGAPHIWRGGRKQTTVLDLVPESAELVDDVVRFTVAGRTFQVPAAQVAEVVETDTLVYPRPSSSKLHPTMKPVALFSYLMRNSSHVGDAVLDLFGGSGTTIIAAEETHRRAYVMELDPRYCDVIRRRWAEFRHGDGCDWRALTPAVE